MTLYYPTLPQLLLFMWNLHEKLLHISVLFETKMELFKQNAGT